MDRYVVIGNPVAHSLSPAIHARFAQATGQSLEYGRLLAPIDGFGDCAAEFFAGGGTGANVTLPFKLEAFEFANARSERAVRAGAANFLMLRDEGVFADNTDGAGLVADLTRNLQVPVRGASLLVIGAGGATRGVLAPLLAEGPRRLVIANRTVAKARELALAFASLGNVEACGLDVLPPERFDILVNATSTSTHGEKLELPGVSWHPGLVAYDMAYGPSARAFVDGARAMGARASDGLGMLVEQAAESFHLWRGVRPATAPVLAELRKLHPA
jgi:shikimate dehydrogenase